MQKSLIMLVRIQGNPLDHLNKIKYKKLLQARIVVSGRSLVDEKTLQGHTNRVTCLIKLNETQIASGSRDYSIIIWDLINEKCLKTLKGHTGWIFCILKLNEREKL